MTTTDSAAPLRVDIWSDVQCPWCYIGKRKFERGVEIFGDDVEVEFHSFELAPDTPVDYDGTPAQYLSERKGIPLDQVDQMLRNVTDIAASVGLEYDFDSVHQTNTVLAHELLHYAKAHDRQQEMKERLLSAYFVEGRHVGHVDDLVALAADIGLDANDVRHALTSHTYRDAVAADMAHARAYGINGVPFYVIDGRYGVSGAQDPQVFADVLAQARDTREATNDAP